jgi:hypothetical protein
MREAYPFPRPSYIKPLKNSRYVVPSIITGARRSRKFMVVPYSLLERTPPQLVYGCFLSLLFAQHMEGGIMISFLL